MTRLLLLAALLLCGCTKEPDVVQQGANGFSAGRIGQIDGCNVWRFEDGAWDHYAVICPTGRHASVQSYVPCGKNCTRPEGTYTVEAPDAPTR